MFTNTLLLFTNLIFKENCKTQINYRSSTLASLWKLLYRNLCLIEFQLHSYLLNISKDKRWPAKGQQRLRFQVLFLFFRSLVALVSRSMSLVKYLLASIHVHKLRKVETLTLKLLFMLHIWESVNGINQFYLRLKIMFLTF